MEVNPVQFLVLIEAREHVARGSRHRINLRLRALRANLLHHALHRRVDRVDADVLRFDVGFQDAVPRASPPQLVPFHSLGTYT